MMSDYTIGDHEFSQTNFLRTVAMLGGWDAAFSHGMTPDSLAEDVDRNFKYKVTKLHHTWYEFDLIRKEVDRKWSL